MRDHDGPKVVVGVSTSVAGLAALRFGVAEAVRRGVPLYAVRSWPFGARWHGPSAAFMRQECTDQARQAVADTFDAAMGGPPAGVDVIVATPCGRTDLVLTDIACDAGDLLVLGGPAGRPWWPNWIVRGCTRRARCPVAVVPPPELARTHGKRMSGRRLLREMTRHDAGRPDGTKAR